MTWKKKTLFLFSHHPKIRIFAIDSTFIILHMKRRSVLQMIQSGTLTCIMLTILLLVSCSQEKVYKIGMSQCGSGQWREKVNNEMLAAQHLYEQSAEVIICNAQDDTQLQIKQIDSLVNAGIDLLVVAPNEAKPIAEAIGKVRKQGIPVIFFDRKASTDDYTAFIGGSNIEAGQAAGEFFIQKSHQLAATGTKPFVMEITG
ncbi:MAG: substrate-binding domain-containing protein, partial [Prevotella sp.]|nr:substrate-binding domain-containing protein [Prevotella sp.]